MLSLVVIAICSVREYADASLITNQRAQRASTALEVLVDELRGALGIVLDVVAQGAVVEGTQLGDDTIDHVSAEHAVLLKCGTQLLQTVGTGNAAVGQTVELVEACSVGGIVDVHVNVGLLGQLQSIFHLKAVAAGYAQAGKQLIDVG